MTFDSPLIAMLVLGIGLAFLFGAAAQRLRISPIVGYLLAGVAVGPYTPGFVADANLAQQLADVGITPYVNRLAMLKLERMWADRPRLADWYARVRARPNFGAAILAYDEDGYRSLMAEQGAAQWPAVAAAIDAA